MSLILSPRIARKVAWIRIVKPKSYDNETLSHLENYTADSNQILYNVNDILSVGSPKHAYNKPKMVEKLIKYIFNLKSKI